MINFSLESLSVTGLSSKIGRHVGVGRGNAESWKNETFFKIGSEVEII